MGVSWNHTFDPTLMIHLLGGYLRTGGADQTPLPNAKAILNAVFATAFPLGSGGVPFPQPPGIDISGYTSTATSYSAEYPGSVRQFNGDVTKVWRRHTFKAGYSLHTYNMFIVGNYPSETYDNLPAADLANTANTGNAFASALLGLPSGALHFLGDTSQMIFAKIHGAYLQDQIRVTPKLNVNVGVRFDYLAGLHEIFDRMDGFDFYTGLYLMARIPPPCPQAGFCLPGPLPPGVAATKSFIDPNWGNYGPRFGFAYRLTFKTVLRSGWGWPITPGKVLFRKLTMSWVTGLQVRQVDDVNLGLATPGGPAPASRRKPLPRPASKRYRHAVSGRRLYSQSASEGCLLPVLQLRCRTAALGASTRDVSILIKAHSIWTIMTICQLQQPSDQSATAL